MIKKDPFKKKDKKIVENNQSKFKKLAMGLVNENTTENAVESIAQNVLDQHYEMGVNEFNQDLMPDESDIPVSSDYYEMIKKLVRKALKNNEKRVDSIDINKE